MENGKGNDKAVIFIWVVRVGLSKSVTFEQTHWGDRSGSGWRRGRGGDVLRAPGQQREPARMASVMVQK